MNENLTSTSQSAPGGILSECRGVLSDFRAAAGRLIKAAPTRIDRATDLQVSLGINARLAWQFFRLANSEDVLASVGYIPLPDGMEKVLAAARRARFKPTAVEGAAKAYGRFEELSALHAGDRASFDAMVSGLQDGASEHIEATARRAAYRANAQLWGVQAMTTYRCLIAGAAGTGMESPSVIIQGSRGVHALRPRRRLPVCRRTITMTPDGEGAETVPEVVTSGLIEDFCSANLPRIKTRVHGSVAGDFIELTGLGLTARVDVFRSTMLRSPFDSDELGVTSMIRTPSEEYVADLVVPAGVVDPSTATVRVYGCLEDVPSAEPVSEEYLLASDHRVEYLGHDLDALELDSFKRCPELIRFVLRDIGRGRESFDLFRCRVRYPVLHTVYSLRVRRRAGAAGTGVPVP